MHQKRQPSNTAQSAVDLMASAQSPIPEPPAGLTLTKRERPHWDRIMRARAHDEWGLVELELAHQLAHILADVKEQTAALEAESYVISQPPNGTYAVNPRATALSRLMAIQLRLLTALRITGNVVGDSEDLLPRRKAEREAQKALRRAQVGFNMHPDEPPLIPTGDDD